MHVYRYQYKTKKKINLFVPGIVIGIAVLILLFGEQEHLFTKLKQEIRTVCYEKMLQLYMPELVYSEGGMGQKTIAETLLAHFFPLGKQDSTMADYPTQVESALSYELILAREAADENYVDEDGELVLREEMAQATAGAGAGTGEGEGAGGNAGAGAGTDGMAGAEGSLDVRAGIEEAAGAGLSGAGELSGVGGMTGTEGYAGKDIGVAGTGVMPDGTVPANTDVLAGAVAKMVTYPREKLNDFDFLIQNFYQVDNTTTIDGKQLNAETLLGRDMRLTHDASSPQILIYHTHSQEGYKDSRPGDLAMSVVGVGDYLTKVLTEQYGLNVLHHKGTYDVGDRDHAYSKAGPALEQILAENPSIEVVIDLHRDGVREETRLVTNMNGKDTAQIMFFNGLSRTTKTGDIAYLSNPYITDNLALSFQMQLAAAEYYPGFTRRVYLKGYRYNMHYCPKTLLVEVGAQTNTFGEALNAMEPLADILNKVLTETQ